MSEKMYITVCADNCNDTVDVFGAYIDQKTARDRLRKYYKDLVSGEDERIENKSTTNTSYSVLYTCGDYYYGKVYEIEVPGKEYPELERYDPETHSYDFDRDSDADDFLVEHNIELIDIGRYEVVYEIAWDRYYAYFDAVNADEALGQFFRQHPHLTFSCVVEVLEV